MSEEEFGLPSKWPITFPCDSMFMDYIMLLVRQGLGRELERTVINSVTIGNCSLAAFSHEEYAGQQSLVSGYWM